MFFVAYVGCESAGRFGASNGLIEPLMEAEAAAEVGDG
jgi:hypothetical protein